jgi:hypothetical protein
MFPLWFAGRFCSVIVADAGGGPEAALNATPIADPTLGAALHVTLGFSVPAALPIFSST